MKILAPTVGPIVGYTTPTQSRIFVRGDAQFVDDALPRCFAAVRVKPTKRTTWDAPRVNKLAPHFDVTAVIVVDGLAPDTQYDYQAGWFALDADLEAVQAMPSEAFEWSDRIYCFTTGPADALAARSYVVGSCRYLLKLFGGLVFDERGDKAFRSMLDQIYRDGRPIDALVMVGDQIYADDLGGLAPDQCIDAFLARYREVFAQPFIRELMSQVPTYMILDDHEIEDNWPAKASPQDRRTLLPHALHAYQIYQGSHGPVFPVVDGRIDGTPAHFWYTFEDGCAEWFVMDARTERRIAPDEPRMIDDAQMAALLDWLADGSDKVKLVVSSVPVFPDMNYEADDKWGGFPSQRRQVLEHVFSRRIGKVVFLSGDVHCSYVARLEDAADPTFAVHAVVSSSLFWPYFHTAESSFLFDVPLAGMGPRSLTTRALAPVYSGNNFVRMDVSPDAIRVALFERKGDPIDEPVMLRL